VYDEAYRVSPGVRENLRPLPTLLVTVALLMLPALTVYGWEGVWTWAPDLAVVLLVLAAPTATAAAVRLVTSVGPRPGVPSAR
jgi:hypothetical protein